MPSTRLSAAFTVESLRILRSRSAFGLIVLAPLIYGALVSATLSRPTRAQNPDRRRRRRRDGAQPRDRSNPERRPVAAGGRAAGDARRWPAIARASGACSASSRFPATPSATCSRATPCICRRYVDSTYLILYSRVLGGITEAIGDVNLRELSSSARADGSLAFTALAERAAGDRAFAASVQSDRRLCELRRARRVYVDPATDLADGRRHARRGLSLAHAASRIARRYAISVVLGRALAHMAFAAPGFVLFLYMLPRFYGLTAMASPLTLALIAAPYRARHQLPRTMSRRLFRPPGGGRAGVDRH